MMHIKIQYKFRNKIIIKYYSKLIETCKMAERINWIDSVVLDRFAFHCFVPRREEKNAKFFLKKKEEEESPSICYQARKPTITVTDINLQTLLQIKFDKKRKKALQGVLAFFTRKRKRV